MRLRFPLQAAARWQLRALARLLGVGAAGQQQRTGKDTDGFHHAFPQAPAVVADGGHVVCLSWIPPRALFPGPMRASPLRAGSVFTVLQKCGR
ncbi:hypothetical protein STPYR_10509 [uncultured Stenotrophomonas sp.]|uniref:Uncharacterized protein n=1 Tax=uncultured Stenotrophomonas sp. TaxID=165438 RepID=A0A1Y5PZZ4_9GAMM|nr:hypothetical protein STPYR_10509 [uncultured Stenotrophomonas sp.]